MRKRLYSFVVLMLTLPVVGLAEEYFHIDDFNSLGGGSFGRLVALEGSQSLWCGARPSGSPPLNTYVSLPGYGNDWVESWESRTFSVVGSVTVAYKVAWDSEPSYDLTFFEYRDKNDNWINAATYSGVGQAVETVVIPDNEHNGTIALRFRFASDANFSDQDGLWDTDGAVIIDSIVVADTWGWVSFEDFELESSGDTKTLSGDWRNGSDDIDLLVEYDAMTPHQEVLDSLAAVGGEIMIDAELVQFVVAKVDPGLQPTIEGWPFVIHVEPARPPDINAIENARMLTGVDAIEGTAPLYLDGLSGRGVAVALKEGQPPDCDLMGRITYHNFGSLNLGDGHAASVAGIMAGDGAGWPGQLDECHGIAPLATVHAWSWKFGAATPTRIAARDHNVAVFNHSTAGGICSMGEYGYSERYMDAVVYEQDLLVVRSAGNSNTSVTSSPHYCNFGPYFTLPSSATAKNVLIVGAIENASPSAIVDLSSFGPPEDGRIKPDIMAVGRGIFGIQWPWPGGPTPCFPGGTIGGGTSFSSPMVAGIGALLIERYRQLHTGTNPKSELMRAVLCNTATDIVPPVAPRWPDYKTGYGLVNAERAKSVIDASDYIVSAIPDGATHDWTFSVSGSCSEFRVMLAWTDYEGHPANNLRQLVNDLDLELLPPGGGSVLPFMLDKNDPTAEAVRTVNTLDNMEQVVAENPAAGTWTASRERGPAGGPAALRTDVVAVERMRGRRDRVRAKLRLSRATGAHDLCERHRGHGTAHHHQRRRRRARLRRRHIHGSRLRDWSRCRLRC